MIISLVNPHDVLFYPKTFDDSLYPESDLDGSIQLPSSANDSFKTKPAAQASHLFFSFRMRLGTRFICV